ncbi:hypothetical protein KIH39_17655 [Telmatocola sphagniphila]|uniref:Uncharacterized protein n=1 Tax=Telmatocola sphagniphila TaxID=1123043 RepID=A0A8E6EWY1_9BACT|nr:DUF6800 family protein [Telmatocola sphagniphila]QVL30671.1 hypothetical protein KIH39_17655 [Telmatocola sphagniphila]
MVERRAELKRRYHRKKKVPKLKAKLEKATSEQDKEKLIYKIHSLSPWINLAPAKQA